MRAIFACSLAVVVAGCSGGSGPAAISQTTAPVAPSTPSAVSPNSTFLTNPSSVYGHVFVILEENKDEAVTYSASGAPYLDTTVKNAGIFVPGYYATGHASLDNYISLISGQSPNAETSGDCPIFMSFTNSATASDGQALGAGCVFPDTIPNLADQLRAANIPWKSYDEDMGFDPTREASTCGHPPLNAEDNTEDAEGPSSNSSLGDQYATRHDPFMYFHSIIDDQAYCQEHVVNAQWNFKNDLASIATTPNFVFYTPNLCDDGHDSGCAAPDIAGSSAGNYTGIDDDLAVVVPEITGSPAFQKDGLLIIIFDEADTSDTSTCCGEMPGPTDPDPGEEGMGGGNTGAVFLSPFIAPGTTTASQYNHYALLASLEDIFGLPRIGYAAAPGLNSIAKDTTITMSASARKTDVYALVSHRSGPRKP